LNLLRLKRRRQSRAVAQLLKRHRRPAPRLAAGRLLAKRNLATAMIDVSDGLIQDLGHICQASAVGANLQQEKLPLSSAYRALAGKFGMRHALSGGEDYELVFCAARQKRKRIQTLGTQVGVPMTRIGVCVPAANGIRVMDTVGLEVAVKAQGHDHFKKQ
jgi:thiamine-monophosphate kinase